uniref:Uncharacterized protein n=1 Tax=Anguilla anguilla TaxID=7936 RepID=A0A0E9W871_ANGAN
MKRKNLSISCRVCVAKLSGRMTLFFFAAALALVTRIMLHDDGSMSL